MGWRSAIPATLPHTFMNWSESDDPNSAWRHVTPAAHAGYHLIEEEEVRADPVARVMARSYDLEAGVTHQSRDGIDVTMDAAEQRALRGAGEGSAAAAQQAWMRC